MALFWTAAAWAGQPPPQIDEPLELGRRSPADAAVVLANEDYLALPDVPYAERDAQLVADTLVRSRGVPPEHLVELTGVNRDQMLQAVDQAAAHLGEGGTLWIYFAGHGAASPSTGEPLLVGDDAKQDPVVFASRSVPLAELRDRVQGRVVFILDTCYAGVGRGGEQLVPGTRFAVPVYARPVDADTVLWTAAGPDQISGPYPAARHGLFTYFAMGALRGWADGVGEPSDDRVTLAEAQAYVTGAFQALQVFGQSPVLTGSADDAVVEGRALEGGPELHTLAPPTPLDRLAEGPSAVIPELARPFGWPISHREGQTWVDAYNVELRRATLFDLAAYDTDGRKSVRRWRSASVTRWLALPVMAGSAYGTYLAGWDTTVGHNLDRDEFDQLDATLTVGGAALTGAVLGFEIASLARRVKLRTDVEDAANRVVSGQGR